jgi:hypothetical protein
MTFRPRAKRLVQWLVAIICASTITAAAALFAAVSPANAEGAAPDTKLLIRYATVSACTVYLNYPKDGVLGNELPWTVPAGETVVWRYNVNSTWALISYPKRAHEVFPWWGFTRRDCLGKSIAQSGYPADVDVPQRVLEGRSRVAASGWRPVDLSVAPAPVVQSGRAVVHDATLRDPANFVIGNVPASWHVDVTGNMRSNGHWVEVYVPNAKRWGYIEKDALGG